MTNPVSLAVLMSMTVADIIVWTHNLAAAAQFIS